MQMRKSRKHVWLGLLLCFLFLTSFTGFLNTGILPAAGNDLASFSSTSQPWSMNSDADSSRLDYLSTPVYLAFYSFSAKPAHSLLAKNG